jgi:hypothetical protein
MPRLILTQNLVEGTLAQHLGRLRLLAQRIGLHLEARGERCFGDELGVGVRVARSE